MYPYHELIMKTELEAFIEYESTEDAQDRLLQIYEFLFSDLREDKNSP
jgi:flagellin-specific chaperone FliS